MHFVLPDQCGTKNMNEGLATYLKKKKKKWNQIVLEWNMNISLADAEGGLVGTHDG